MTFAEKARKEHPELCDGLLGYPTHCCPHHESFGYEEFQGPYRCTKMSCRECWNREIPEETVEEPETRSHDQVVADYLWSLYETFQESGFDKAQAFALTMTAYEVKLKNSCENKKPKR